MRWVIAIVLATVSLACAAKTSSTPPPQCRSGTVANYLAPAAQLCWYQTAQGRWRIVNHEFHYDVLVMDTEATTLELTTEIVRRVSGRHGERFGEIMVYVREMDGVMIRRARWTRTGPTDILDFPAPTPQPR